MTVNDNLILIGPPPSLPTISALRIALKTRRTSPLSQSDLVPWHQAGQGLCDGLSAAGGS
jgi:hypothetical protein